MAVGQDIVRDGAGYKVKHKNVLETKSVDEWELKYTVSNKSHEIKVEYEPTDMNKDGQKVQLEVESKCEPKDNKWSVEAEVKAGGFDMGPIKPFTNVSAILMTHLAVDILNETIKSNSFLLFSSNSKLMRRVPNLLHTVKIFRLRMIITLLGKSNLT